MNKYFLTYLLLTYFITFYNETLNLLSLGFVFLVPVASNLHGNAVTERTKMFTTKRHSLMIRLGMNLAPERQVVQACLKV